MRLHDEILIHYTSGIIAAAYVNGLQANGISATIKHFVGNDQEHERTAANSIISDRALREIYLYPCACGLLTAPSSFLSSISQVHACTEIGQAMGVYDLVSAYYLDGVT